MAKKASGEAFQIKIDNNCSTFLDEVLPLHMFKDESELFLRTMHNSKKYMEFGSGGSTWSAANQKSIKEIYSIESDPAWITKLQEYSTIAKAIADRRLFFIYANIGPVGHWGNPQGYPDSGNWRQYMPNFMDYFLGPCTYLPMDADYVLIDGRFRIQCALISAIMTTKTQCLFALHDTDYPELAVLHDFFDEQESASRLSILTRKKNFNADSAIKMLYKNFFSVT